MSVEKVGTLTCPRCGHKQGMEIPRDRCIPFYKCEGCGNIIAATGSCCVFCDYADTPCPVGEKANPS